MLRYLCTQKFQYMLCQHQMCLQHFIVALYTLNVPAILTYEICKFFHYKQYFFTIRLAIAHCMVIYQVSLKLSSQRWRRKMERSIPIFSQPLQANTLPHNELISFSNRKQDLIYVLFLLSNKSCLHAWTSSEDLFENNQRPFCTDMNVIFSTFTIAS